MVRLALQTTVKFLKDMFYKVIKSVFFKYFIRFLLFTYIFIYCGVWHFVHKHFFEFFGFKFEYQYGFYTPFGVLNFYVAMLDFENLFLFLYVIFYEMGLDEFISERFSWATLKFNWRLLVFHENYWSKGITPSTFLFLCCYNYVSSCLNNYALYETVTFFFCQYPVFYYFALLFFFNLLRFLWCFFYNIYIVDFFLNFFVVLYQ